MNRISFARSILFAAGAALATPAVLLLLRPLLDDSRDAGPWVWVAMAAAYLVTFGGTPRRSFAGAAAIVATGAATIGLTHDWAAVVLAVALAIACLRSGVRGNGARARTIALEAVLHAGGLALAALCGSGSFFGMSVAIWSYYLAQSLYPIASAIRWPAAADRARDPFDAAARQLRQLLRSTG